MDEGFGNDENNSNLVGDRAVDTSVSQPMIAFCRGELWWHMMGRDDNLCNTAHLIHFMHVSTHIFT